MQTIILVKLLSLVISYLSTFILYAIGCLEGQSRIVTMVIVKWDAHFQVFVTLLLVIKKSGLFEQVSLETMTSFDIFNKSKINLSCRLI